MHSRRKSPQENKSSTEQEKESGTNCRTGSKESKRLCRLISTRSSTITRKEFEERVLKPGGVGLNGLLLAKQGMRF